MYYHLFTEYEGKLFGRLSSDEQAFAVDNIHARKICQNFLFRTASACEQALCQYHIDFIPHLKDKATDCTTLYRSAY